LIIILSFTRWRNLRVSHPLIEGGEVLPHPVIVEENGSDLPPSGSTPPVPQDSQVRRTGRNIIPRHHFEIEGRLDLDETTSYW
ncbi:unnamed protein product, partial [Ilex paraguariensis]